MQPRDRSTSAHRALRKDQKPANALRALAHSISARVLTTVTGPITTPPMLGVPFLFKWLCGPNSYMV